MESIPQASGIYQILCVPTGKIYIGSAVNLRKRWRNHCYLLDGKGKRPHHNIHLQRAWDKYGADAFTFTVIELAEPNRLIEREQFYLDSLTPYVDGNGYNVCTTAGSILGVKRSPEFRAALSERQKVLMNTPAKRAESSRIHKGKKPSPESIEKFKSWRREHPVTDEWKRQHSARMKGRPAPNIGKKPSAETRAKWSKQRKGRVGFVRSYIVTSPDGVELPVVNMAAFCREHGLTCSAMCQVARGVWRAHKGWGCRYAD
jgi:group I intron endonuclease